MAKKKQKKILFIQTNKPIATAVNEYCEEAAMSKEDLSFAMGYLTSRINDKDEGIKQLFMLLQSYFFAGVFYGKTQKFSFKYLSKKKRDEKTEKEDLRISEMLKPKRPAPSYMG